MGRRVRKIEVPTDTPSEFELGIQLLIYRGGGREGAERERDEETTKEEREREEEKTTHLAE